MQLLLTDMISYSWQIGFTITDDDEINTSLISYGRHTIPMRKSGVRVALKTATLIADAIAVGVFRHFKIKDFYTYAQEYSK